jgi:hypothetical protein
MSEENEFDMGIFGEGDDVKLNLGEDDPFDIKKHIEGEDDDDSTPADEDDDKPEGDEDDDQEEGKDPENVVSKKDKDDDKEDDPDSDGDSPKIFTSFATMLAEKGLLSSFNSETDDIKTEDDLTNVIKKEIDSQSQSYLREKLGQDGFDALEKGVSLQEYQNYKNTVDSLDSVDEESLSSNMELSKQIILEDYKAQGMTEERATRILNKSVGLGDESVLEDAIESLASLKETQKLNFAKHQETRNTEKQTQIKNQEKIDNDLKNSVYNTDEIIKGVKINKEIKDRMYSTMTGIVGKNEDGIPENKLMHQRRENPIEFDTKLYYLYEMTKGFSDFSKLMSTTETKVTSNFEKALRSNKNFENSGSPDFLNDADSYNGIGDELNI